LAPRIINAPVFTLIVIDGVNRNKSQIVQPTVFEFRKLVDINRSNPQCCYWQDDRTRLVTSDFELMMKLLVNFNLGSALFFYKIRNPCFSTKQIFFRFWNRRLSSN